MRKLNSRPKVNAVKWIWFNLRIDTTPPCEKNKALIRSDDNIKMPIFVPVQHNWIISAGDSDLRQGLVERVEGTFICWLMHELPRLTTAAGECTCVAPPAMRQLQKGDNDGSNAPHAPQHPPEQTLHRPSRTQNRSWVIKPEDVATPHGHSSIAPIAQVCKS